MNNKRNGFLVFYSYEIIGCYCQTELGHGSDVQNLETVAEYDVKT